MLKKLLGYISEVKAQLDWVNSTIQDNCFEKYSSSYQKLIKDQRESAETYLANLNHTLNLLNCGMTKYKPEREDK